jgi:hypothetical protein
MNFWKGKNSPQYRYFIQNTQLENVESVKYLGVRITNDLSWGKHIREITGLANRKLGFVRRILGKCDDRVREISYFSLVRPHLEYAASVWDPYEVGLEKELDRIQRRSARYVKSRYDNLVSVTDLLEQLGWESLSDRRLNIRLNLFCKFKSSLFSEDVNHILRSPTYYGRSDHENKIREIDCRTDRFKMSFFPRSIRDYNGSTRT